jgi:hypothetical protein
MRIVHLACKRAAFVFAVAMSLSTARVVTAQVAADADAPTLSDRFVFTLGPQRDDAVHVVAHAIEEHEEVLRARELESANASVFNRLIDLLRYVPLRVSGSDGGDFFNPTYFRPGYMEIPHETRLFDTR